jgi:multiple sugar transport system permease protein
VTFPATASVVITSTAAGYVFAKYSFPAKESIFTAILSTMMVPFAVIVIPLFVTMSNLHLVDNLLGILLTSIVSAFGIFLMRQSVETIPDDYVDAARIDGASEAWIFAHVIVPLSKASMSTLGVFIFLGNWDNYLWPSILLRSESQRTLPVIIAGMRSLYQVRYQIWSAAGMLTVVPVMVLFTLAQKQFVAGLTLAGLKG